MFVPSDVPSRLRGGGKEEVRASVLRTYLLRLREQEGQKAVDEWLESADIDPQTANNEMAWLSVGATRRALAGIAALWGEQGLVDRGDWATHPDALGSWVRMLREARTPLDAYRFFATHAREVTRVGTWETVEATAAPEHPVRIGMSRQHARLVYRATGRASDEGSGSLDAEGEALLCAARRGELASLPRIWGYDAATVEHPMCIARGDEACMYEVSWKLGRRHMYSIVAGCGFFPGVRRGRRADRWARRGSDGRRDGGCSRRCGRDAA